MKGATHISCLESGFERVDDLRLVGDIANPLRTTARIQGNSRGSRDSPLEDRGQGRRRQRTTFPPMVARLLLPFQALKALYAVGGCTAL
jgi:hypothetical protein